MIGPIAAAGTGNERQRLEHACAQLEGVFMNELAKAMRETVPQDGILPASTGSEMFSGMLDEQLAQLAAVHSRSGLRAALLKQLEQQP